ncbi:MAG TPA: hypothetical protein VND64_15475 [Pirellulales bacterium]|nr:hypothetical protein [Pirellulales bacterium]
MVQAALVWLVLAQSASAHEPEVRLSGVVRTSEGQQPIAGVALRLSNGRTQARAITDEQGRYECLLSPGLISGEISDGPAEFVKPMRAFRAPVVVTPEATEQTLPPIELVRGRRVRGTVVDESGQGVAGVDVQAAWRVIYEPWLESGVRGPTWAATTTDAQGGFVLEGTHPNFKLSGGRILDSEIRLSAALGDRSTEGAIDVPPLGEEPITLRISAGKGVALGGRVRDRAGRPLPGAVVEIWSQWKTPFGFVIQTPLVFNGSVELVTDAEGHFRTLPRLARGGQYRAVARAAGFVPDRTALTRPETAHEARFAELRLARLCTVTGRVVDRNERPVAGANVFQSGDGVERTQTRTDDQGRFVLPGVSEDAGFIFAEKADFCFQGERLGAGANEIEITLSRADELPPEPASQPAVCSTDEKLALARRLLGPYVERAFASGDADVALLALATLVSVDPAAALEKIDAQAVRGADQDAYDYQRRRTASRLFRESPDEAMAVAESIHDPDSRFRAYIDLAGLVEPSQQRQKRELLDQAQLLMVATQDAGLRATWIYCVSDGLLDLGETDRAKGLLEEARSIAATLPRAGNGGDARGYVAQALARVDLPAALELARDLEEDKVFDGTHGKIASRIAQARPAESERVLGMVRDEFRRGSWAIRVCYRMAGADPERARRIADQIANPYLRAYALGLMAKAWSGSDKRRAQGWLDEAFAELARVVEAGEERIGGPQPAAGVAAALLPVAELIDARLVQERLWRTLSFRRAHSARREHEVEESTSVLTLLVARHDRCVARWLLEPLVARARAGGLDALPAPPDSGDLLFCAAVAIDPHWALELFDELAAGVADSDDRLNNLRQRLAWTLARPPERIIRDYVEMWLNHWVPDMPDNEFYVEY